jgi:hypothetical protein
MPNGDYETTPEEWEAVHCFFDSMCRQLTTFASNHRLVIDKYYHDSKTWTFRFRHPFDGVANIEVGYIDGVSLSIWSCWQVSDYDRGTLSSRQSARTVQPLEPAQLQSLLDGLLRDVLSWRRGEWTDVATGYSEWRRHFTKEEFARLDENYPRVLAPGAWYPEGSQQRIDFESALGRV